MALPVLKTAGDCAHFSKTVTPFLHQLRPLPYMIFDSISSPAALAQIYLDTNPLMTAFAFSLFLAPVFLIISEANRNYSQVDRVWSILPTVYIAHYTLFAHLSGLPTARLDALLGASCLWSTRLTFNYWRKGGYTIGSEDYRWEILRKYINAPLFFLFNVFFISLAQSILLFMITMPAYVLVLTLKLSQFSDEVVAWEDKDLYTGAAMFVLVLLTFIADQQQWNFQEARRRYRETARVTPPFTQQELDRGFVTTGLWAYSRHPNFAAEQTVWAAVYQWGCFASGTLYNWTAVGPIAYVCLFQASTWFTELVSAGKYPEYKVYQQLVAKFIPKRGAGPMKWVDEKAEQEKKLKEKEEAAKAKPRYDLR